MIQKAINFLKSQVWQVDGVTLTVGGVILIVILAYLLFFRK
jgi:hypothetical protein